MEPWKPLSFKEFDALEKEPLDRKVERAVAVIREAVNLSKHQMAVAFSGGKDSTVLLHLMTRHFPELRPWVIFANTGIEYPESLRFARQMGKELAGERYVEALPDKLEEDGLKYQAQQEVLEWLVQAGRVSEVLKEDGKLKSTRALELAATPEMWEDFRRRNLVWRKGMRKSFWWCCDQYGFPLLGKSKSKLDARRINIDCFLRFSASESENPELLEYYRLLRNVKISQHCCKELKKAPSERAQAEHDVDVIFKGLMGTESRTRKISFITRGYIIQSHREHLPPTDPFWHVSPMATWTDADVWAYIKAYLFLTKNPVRYMHLISNGIIPENQPNFWFGSTATIPEMEFFWCDEVNTFVSIEPILAPFEDLTDEGVDPASKTNWIIVGAETGNRKNKVVPQKSWIDEIVSAAKKAGTPVFMKESLREIMGDDFKQEFPWEVNGCEH